MAQALSGRVEAYDAGLAAADEALEGALKRNLYGTQEAVTPSSLSAMAAYLRGQTAHLSGQGDEAALAGTLAFADPPQAA